MRTCTLGIASICLVVLGTQAYAGRTSTRLTPDNLSEQPYAITVAVKKSDIANDPTLTCTMTVAAKSGGKAFTKRHWANLEVRDDQAIIASCHVQPTELDGTLTYSFTIDPTYAKKSHFGFYEDLSAANELPAGSYYWFRPCDFAPR